MILYHFPIAQNTGPVELRFGSNLSSDRLLCVISILVLTYSLSEINSFTTGSAESYFIAEP